MILQAKYNTNIVLYKIVGRVYIMILFDKFKKMSAGEKEGNLIFFFFLYLLSTQSK